MDDKQEGLKFIEVILGSFVDSLFTVYSERAVTSF